MNAPKNGNSAPVDLNPYLDNSRTSRCAEFLYRNIFEPLEKLADRVSTSWTRKWVEREMKWVDSVMKDR